MSKDISYAIQYLPAHLFTRQIVEHAAKNGSADLIDYIPKKFLTTELVNKLIKKKKSYYHIQYDLRKIPKKMRTIDICVDAVERNVRNIIYVPADIKNTTMLELLVHSAKKNLHLLQYIQPELWTTNAAYNGLVNLIESKGYYGFTDNDYRMVGIFLSFVPASLKNARFYYGLFNINSMPTRFIEVITPSKYKQKEYYKLMAKKDFSSIPLHKINYEIMFEGLKYGTGVLNYFYDIVDKSPLGLKFFSLLDAPLADAFVMSYPSRFSALPKKYKNEKRLLLALQHRGNSDNSEFLKSDDLRLLSPRVCRELVKIDKDYPIFPDEVWTDDFVKFCVEHGHSYVWFKQAPKDMQTQEMVNSAITANPANMKYANKRFITPEMAMRSYRDHQNNGKVLFQLHYLTEFTMRTGLPKEFFGGQVTLKQLKDQRIRCTYAKVGDTYIGIYKESIYDESATEVIMTRYTSSYEQPQQVFRKTVGTFHKTWLEKMISDSDPLFAKPKVSPSLRAVQSLSYYGVREIGLKEGIMVYANTFLDEVMGYCAVQDGITYHDNTIHIAVRGLKIKLGHIKDEVVSLDSTISYTAEMLHQKYNYCYIGMTAFAEDYGLDINGTYTLEQLKLAVKAQGIKNSARSYRSELRKIRVISA